MQRPAKDTDRLRRHPRGFREPGRGARARAAQRLSVPDPADLVSRRHLPRHPAARVLERAIGVLAPAGIRRVEPLRGLTCVPVVIHVGSVLGAAARVSVHEIPQPIERSAPRACRKSRRPF